MKVSSPIGDLPFEPRSIRLGVTGVRVDGVMGAWPATVHISGEDIPALARLVAKPALLIAATTATALGVIRVLRGGR